MFLRRMCEQLQNPPRGYRVAYPILRGRLICYPVGLHLIVRWFRALWYRIATREATVEELAYQRGYNCGYISGATHADDRNADKIHLLKAEVERLSQWNTQPECTHD